MIIGRKVIIIKQNIERKARIAHNQSCLDERSNSDLFPATCRAKNPTKPQLNIIPLSPSYIGVMVMPFKP